jgi:hypothetical protein
MKTVKLTADELATIKTAIIVHIQSLEREIRTYQEKAGHVPAGLLENETAIRKCI